MKDITTQIIEDIIKSPDFEALKRKAAYLIKSAIQKDRRELVSKAIEMARENNEGVEITICPEMKYTQQQILEKLEVRDV